MAPAVEGPLSSASHPSSVGTWAGKHLRMNIPANLSLHLPFLKAPLKPHVDVSMQWDLAATP